VLFLVYSCIPARQLTDICSTRCSILSRFSHFHVSHFPPLQYGTAFSCPASSCLAFSASPCWWQLCKAFNCRIFNCRHGSNEMTDMTWTSWEQMNFKLGLQHDSVASAYSGLKFVHNCARTLLLTAEVWFSKYCDAVFRIYIFQRVTSNFLWNCFSVARLSIICIYILSFCCACLGIKWE